MRMFDRDFFERLLHEIAILWTAILVAVVFFILPFWVLAALACWLLR